MARPHIPVDVVRVAVEGHFGPTPWVNTFWLLVTTSGTPTAAEMNGLAAAFLSSFNTQFVHSSNNQSATSQCLMEWNDGAGGFVEGTDATPVSGSETGTPLPASAAFVLSWRIGVRYRGGHPRTYLAGRDEGAMATVNTWASTHVAELQTRANAFLAAINALTPSGFTSVTLGVLRQFADGGSEADPQIFLTPPVFVPFTNVIAKPGIATQRRRLGDNLS